MGHNGGRRREGRATVVRGVDSGHGITRSLSEGALQEEVAAGGADEDTVLA